MKENKTIFFLIHLYLFIKNKFRNWHHISYAIILEMVANCMKHWFS